MEKKKFTDEILRPFARLKMLSWSVIEHLKASRQASLRTIRTYKGMTVTSRVEAVGNTATYTEDPGCRHFCNDCSGSGVHGDQMGRIERDEAHRR